MIVLAFEWDEANAEHIARHNVAMDEAEEIFDSKNYLFKTRSNRYIVLGRSSYGRYLMCVFEKGKERSSIRIITARDMDHKERKLFNNKVRS
jgi:uncharacterized DUF497 family protein